MVTPIDIHIISKGKAFEVTSRDPIPPSYLSQYLGHRPGILDQIDIFCENVRSKDQYLKDFSLFNRVGQVGPKTVIIYPIYLEIYEFSGQDYNVRCAIETVCSWYKNNIVVFHWNHDHDFNKYNDVVLKNPNARILNFNTSRSTPQDIVMPCWNVETKPIAYPKKHYVGFVGRETHPVRGVLNRCMTGYPGFYNVSGLPPESYRKAISSLVFNLCPRGLGLSSYRFYDSFHVNTIPVLFADDVILPYEGILDWRRLCVRIPEAHAGDRGKILEMLGKADQKDITAYITANREYFTLLGVQKHIHKVLSTEIARV
jgi:hypothetical protein